MREYKSKYSMKEQVDNEDVAIIIQMLKDESFKNKFQRRKMMKALMDLFNIDDKDARVFFRKLGDAMTSVGEDMLAPAERDTEVQTMMDIL